MKIIPILTLFFVISLSGCAQLDIPHKEDQLAMAVLAGPEGDREGATVYGFDKAGALVQLKKGNNSLVCISDDFTKEGFQCVCYHKDLEPFMERGRTLKAEGKNFQEIFDIREKEAKEGILKMPGDGATLHLLEGPDGQYDAATGTIINANYRYVVYIPWATAASTGLPLKPLVPGGPWIMDPGTHRAHIMITPPQ